MKKLGVYIKNFNIPECCYQCFNTEFAYAIGCYKWADMKYKARYEGRAKDCPLVEVKTPHGDLVDHEALGEILLRMRNDDTLTFVEDDEFRKSLLDDVIHETWNDLRTIIEAEGE